MSKAIYVGVGGKARRVSKMYVGAGGKARRVKYGYVGADGKARQFYSAGELSKPAFSAGMSAYANQYGAASVGGYALFAGGSNRDVLWQSDSNTVTATVMSVNSSLTVGTATGLKTARYGVISASTNFYACFMYGARAVTSSNHYNDNTCDVYNASLTRQNISPPVSKSTSSSYSGDEAAQGVGDRIYVRVRTSVYMADKSLTWRKLEDMRDRTSNDYYDHVARSPSIGSVGDEMILAGGLYYHFNSSGSDSYNGSNLVDAYNASGTRRNAGNMPHGGAPYSAASSPDRMLLIGTESSGQAVYCEPQEIQVINKSLTVTNRGNILPDDIERMATASVSGVTIAMGGDIDYRYGPSYNGSNQTARAYMFDESVTCTRAPDASYGRYGHLGVTAGDYMVFGGGKWSKTVDGFTSNYLTPNMDVYCYK